MSIFGAAAKLPFRLGLAGAKRAASGTAHAFEKNPMGTGTALGMTYLTAPYMFRDADTLAANAAQREGVRMKAQGLKELQMSQGLHKTSSARMVIKGLHRLYPVPEKTAGVGAAAKAVAKKAAKGAGKKGGALPVKEMFLLGAAVALGNQAIGALSSGAEHGAQRMRDAYHASTRPARWKALLKYDKDLADMPYAKDAFDAIDRASPYLASEPLLAAGAVRTLVTSGSAYEGGPPVINTQTVKNVLDIQNQRLNLKAARPGAFAQAKPPSLSWSTGGDD